MENHSKYSSVFKICTVVIVLLSVIPFLRAASLTSFRTDDFSSPYAYANSGKTLLAFAWWYTVTWWNQLAGTYASNFLIFLLNPLNWYSYKALRIILLALISVSVVGCYLCLKEIAKHFSINISPIYTLALLLLPLLFYREYYDIYVWFVGAMGYLVPVIGTEFGIYFLLKWNEKKKWTFYLLAILFFVFMCGCTLEMTGFGMWVLLLIVIIDWMYHSKLNKGFLWAFGLALCFAFLNAFAPGNFKRAGALSEEGLNLIGALLYSLKASWQEFGWLHSNASFPLFEILSFILGTTVTLEKKEKGLLPVLVAGLIILPIITVYPVMLGYGYKDNDIVNRCLFIFDAALIICCLGLCFVAGCLNRHRFKAGSTENQKKLGLICVMLASAILLPSVLDGRAQCMPAKIAENLVEGKVMTTSYLQKKVYEEIRDCEEDDVVIGPLPERHEGNTMIKIDEDAESHRNKAISMYFGKNSIICLQSGD